MSLPLSTPTLYPSSFSPLLDEFGALFASEKKKKVSWEPLKRVYLLTVERRWEEAGFYPLHRFFLAAPAPHLPSSQELSLPLKGSLRSHSKKGQALELFLKEQGLSVAFPREERRLSMSVQHESLIDIKGLSEFVEERESSLWIQKERLLMMPLEKLQRLLNRLENKREHLFKEKPPLFRESFEGLVFYFTLLLQKREKEAQKPSPSASEIPSAREPLQKEGRAFV